MSVNSKMTAIADEIRTLSGTTGTMGLDAMASNVSEVNAEVNSQTELLTQAVLALNGKTSGGGGTTGVSVQSDWNQTDETAADFIKNKPFGDVPTGGDTLTWDGNTEGLVSMDAFAEMIGTLYKISDAVPTLEDCISGVTYTIQNDGKQENLSVGYDEIAEMSSFVGCLCIGDLYALAVPENNFQIEVEGVTAIFPEAGLYTNTGGDALLASLTIPGYNGFETTTIQRLDEAYMPLLTSPSGKKFKLSVDDSGTITATEVT